MTLHEITPKQLRALLLLLVLVPFIPMVLMLRFMADAIEGESDAARERFAAVTQRTLSSAAALQEKHLASQAKPVAPEELRRLGREIFDRTIEICIRDSN